MITKVNIKAILGLDIAKVNCLYAHKVMYDNCEIFNYPSNGLEFYDTTFESVVCVDITSAPMVHNCTSRVVNTTIPKHLGVCILFLVFINSIASLYFFTGLCLFLSEKD